MTKFFYVFVSPCNIPSTQQLPDNTEPDNTEPDDTDVWCEHTWGEWLAVKQANCKEEGMLVRTCSKCSETEESILAKNDMHNEVVDVAIYATCTENGKTEGKHCSICNMIIVQQEIVPLVDHIYDNNYDNDCNVCGYTRDVECAHSETETIQGKDATCTETGLTNGIRCKKCGEIIVEQTVLEMKEHSEVIDKGISATCTIAGLTEGLHCSVCNMVLIAQQTINPSHVFLESYEFNGECHWKKCSVCNAIEGEGSHTLNSDGNCDICGSLVKCINAETFASCRKLKSILIGSGIESIYFDAFTGCESLEIVYYKGSAAEWDEISITYSGNSKLISATRYYYSEQQPTEGGTFWHYDEKGEIVIWN